MNTMPVEFSEMEQSIIKNMMLRKSYRDICGLLGCSIEDLTAFVKSETEGTDIITWQMKLDANRPEKTDRTQIPRERPVPVGNKQAEEKKLAFEKREQKRLNQIERMNVEQKRATLRRQPAYKTIVRDYSKMILVRIDRQTQIYVNHGDDVEAAKIRYLEKVKRTKAAYLGAEVMPERHKMAKKECTLCGNEKRLEEFSANVNNKDGKNHRCKTCYSENKSSKKKNDFIL